MSKTTKADTTRVQSTQAQNRLLNRISAVKEVNEDVGEISLIVALGAGSADAMRSGPYAEEAERLGGRSVRGARNAEWGIPGTVRPGNLRGQKLFEGHAGELAGVFYCDDWELTTRHKPGFTR